MNGTQWQFVQNNGLVQRLWVTDDMITNLDTGAWYDYSIEVNYQAGKWLIEYMIADAGTGEVIRKQYERYARRSRHKHVHYLPTEAMAYLSAKRLITNKVQQMDIAKRLITDLQVGQVVYHEHDEWFVVAIGYDTAILELKDYPERIRKPVALDSIGQYDDYLPSVPKTAIPFTEHPDNETTKDAA
jgi:hypothetical protein